jgi:hypothetical protein
MMSLEMFKTTECDCDKCSSMCRAPCTGTPKCIEAIMDAGYGDRLCLDDWPHQPTDIHPALKGYEGTKAPYATASLKGCTFWINGKCELHEKGLKPLGGKIAHHAQPSEEWLAFAELCVQTWDTDEGRRIVERWKKEFMKETKNDY